MYAKEASIYSLISAKPYLLSALIIEMVLASFVEMAFPWKKAFASCPWKIVKIMISTAQFPSAKIVNSDSL